ncbi:hypothetical protein HID58_083290 [Brassica napus]|uniref:Uncharacterized protein n=1 Tax=Brassica napus TaxID=3708 RepID=A0ABQ7YD38_BRANA|nr:uncharacterized protein LOC106415927 [Brassica napus]KAH0866079.1 hypothetical protein HID58_083290 [Brassica napus]
MKRYWSVALVLLLLVAFCSSKHSVQGRPLLRMTHSSQAVRDLQTSKEMKEEKPLRGENDSFRRIPRTGSNPSQNKYNLPVGVQGSRKHQITEATKP